MSDMSVDENIMSLHRYFIWADRMRIHFKDVMARKGRMDNSRYIFEANLYMSYWYGALYVVIEGWKDIGLVDPGIDQLLKSSNTDLLRRYRNGVFHFQTKYYDKRFVNFMMDGENCVEWVHKLTDEFSRYFLNYLKVNKKDE